MPSTTEILLYEKACPKSGNPYVCIAYTVENKAYCLDNNAYVRTWNKRNHFSAAK